MHLAGQPWLHKPDRQHLNPRMSTAHGTQLFTMLLSQTTHQAGRAPPNSVEEKLNSERARSQTSAQLSPNSMTLVDLKTL